MFFLYKEGYITKTTCCGIFSRYDVYDTATNLTVCKKIILINYSVYKKKLRKQDEILIPKPNLTGFSKGFCFVGPKIYNVTPHKIKIPKSNIYFYVS